jgi:hypothetical protein
MNIAAPGAFMDESHYQRLLRGLREAEYRWRRAGPLLLTALHRVRVGGAIDD